MIIVEGPDGSGKTSIIERLRHQRRHLKALRSGIGSEGTGNWGGDDEAPIAYARKILEARDEEYINPPGSDSYGTRIAFDRFHLSEWVYGPLLRGASGISFNEMILVRRLLRALGVQVILCLPPYARTLANVMKEGRERPPYQTVEFLREAYNRFQNVLPRLVADIVFDYTRDTDRALMMPSPGRYLPDGMVGTPGARYMIVGEFSTAALDLPFFSMQNSSGYLNEALWSAGYGEHEMMFANVLTKDGEPRDLRQMLGHLNVTPEIIIALGVEARTQFYRQGINHVPIFTVPHPAFWQRFHSGDANDYVFQLRQVREATQPA